MAMTKSSGPHRRRRASEERFEYLLYATVAFPFFLISALWRRLERPGRFLKEKSIFHEALEGVNTTISWAFSGR